MTSNQAGEVPRLTSRINYVKWYSDFCGYAKRKLFYKIMIGVENAPEPTALLPADEPGAASINYKITQDNRKEARDYADRCDMGFGAPQQAVNDVSTLATRLHHEFGHEAEPNLHHAWLMVRDVMEDANAGAQIGLTLKTMMMKQQSGSFEDFASSFDHHYRLMTEQPTDNTKKMNLLSGLTNDKLKIHADN